MKKMSCLLFGLILMINSLLLVGCQPVAPAQPAGQPTDVAGMEKAKATETNVEPTAAPTAAPTATIEVVKPAEVLWTFAIEKPFWGTPTLSDGALYIGGDDGCLYALDAVSGAMRWKFVTQGIVRSQPAVDGKLVFTASDDGFVYAVARESGEQVWKTDIGNLLDRAKREKLGNSPNPTGYDYRQSSPVVADGKVYVGSLDGAVYALDATTGKEVWKFQTGNKVRATAFVNAGTVYIGSWDELFYALDAQTGAERWKANVGGEVQSTPVVTRATPVFTHGLVITASRKASVFALDAQNGKAVWEYNYGNNMWVESSPFLTGDVVYVGSSGSKMLVGINVKDGKQTTAIYNTTTFNWGTPLVDGDMLYYNSASYTGDNYDGGLAAVRMTDGKLGQTPDFRLAMQNTLDAEGNWSGAAGSPVLGDGVLYIGALDGKVYALKQ
jgi:outer membrane protein assembly factor BamB